jgi:hypothetical protein
MKKLLWIISLVIILSGCKKEGGKLICTMKYTLSSEKKTEHNTKSYTEVKSENYTQFGDFITSITPDRFIGKFLHLNLSNKFLDEWECGIDFFDNHLEISDLRRLADFSNNATVSFTPEDVNIRKDAYLHYFMAICLFWYQEFQLPEEYESVHIQHLQLNGVSNNFDGHTMGGEKFGTLIKADNLGFTEPIFNRTWPEQDDRLPGGHNFFFGNTDSTFVFYTEDDISTIDNPMGQPGYIIRSNNYTPTTIKKIPEGETRTIQGTMSFNTTDLIHIYAGVDNIPYTSDDVFVYAPRFWERISVTLEYY